MWQRKPPPHLLRAIPTTRDTRQSSTPRFCWLPQRRRFQLVICLVLGWLGSSLSRQSRDRSSYRQPNMTSMTRTPTTPNWTEIPSSCVDKQAWMSIFVEAGHSWEQVVQLCPSLPTVQQVHALYGSEPVIVGQERCSAYRQLLSRQQSIGARPLVRVAGLQNTGTNALQQTLMTNLYPLDRSSYFKVPWGKHTPPVPGQFYDPHQPCTTYCQTQRTPRSRRDDTILKQAHAQQRQQTHQQSSSSSSADLELVLEEEEREKKPRASWSHASLRRRRGANMSRPEPPRPLVLGGSSAAVWQDRHVLPVVLVRDPYFWLQSMCRRPYEYMTSIRQFPCPHLVDPTRNPYPVSRVIYPRITTSSQHNLHNQTGETFNKSKGKKTSGIPYHQPSLIHVWKHFYDTYLQADYPRLLIRFEDTLFHPEKVWRAISDCVFGDNVTSRPYQYSLSPSKTDQRSNFLSALVKNSQAHLRVSDLDPMDLEFVHQVLSESSETISLLELFRYPRPPT